MPGVWKHELIALSVADFECISKQQCEVFYALAFVCHVEFKYVKRDTESNSAVVRAHIM